MKKTILSLILGIAFLNLDAQIATRVDQYYQDFSIVNPAAINAANNSSLNVFYNRLFTGVKGSPTNILLSAIFPNPEKHVGFGVNFAQEKIGFSTLYNAYVSYVYSLKLGKKSKLHTAASFGLLSQRFNPNAIDVINQDDPYYLSLQQGKPDNKFDLKASVCYQTAGFLLGFSSGRLTNPRFGYDYYNYNAIYGLSSISNAFMSARLKISKELILQPVISLNIFNFRSTLLNYGLNFYAKDAFWMGIHSAGNKNMSFQLGASINKSIKIGYSYSMPYSSTSKLLGAGHEFFTSINLGKTSELVKDLDYDAITVNKIDSDSSNTSKNGSVLPEKKEITVGSSGNVISVETIKLQHDTIVIGSFEDMKLLKLGYDTGKIFLKDLRQEPPSNGYFVTIGTFRLESNANKYIKIMYAKGYSAYKFFYPESKYYYVYILQAETNEEAEQIKWQEQLEFPDIWVKRVFRK